MDLILSRLAQLEEQARLQAPSIAQLKSENEAQQSSIARLSSENEAQASSITRLSLENETLMRINKDQELVIGELSRAAIPGGFWVWDSRRDEGKEDEGRWLWSLEKFKILPPLAVAAGPPTSLLSLPVELLDIILKLLKRKDHLALCRVSYRLLELASKCVYGKRILLGADAARSLVKSRLFDNSPRIERVTSFLLPTKLRLVKCPKVDAFQDLIQLASSLSPPPSPLRVKLLAVDVVMFKDFKLWMDLLRFLNPIVFEFWTGEVGHSSSPTVRLVPANFVDSFTSNWSRLGKCSALGPESLLIVKGIKGPSVFEACLRRCSPDLPFVQADLWMKTRDGIVSLQPVEEDNLPASLGKVEVGRWGTQLMSLDLSMRKTKR